MSRNFFFEHIFTNQSTHTVRKLFEMTVSTLLTYELNVKKINKKKYNLSTFKTQA